MESRFRFLQAAHIMHGDDGASRKPASGRPVDRPPWSKPVEPKHPSDEKTRPVDRTPVPRLPADPDVPPASAPTSPVRRPPAEEVPPEPSVSPLFRLVRSDQLVLGVLAAVVFCFMGWRWMQLSGFGARPVEVERFETQTLDYQIDLNTADRVELALINGIGETLADRIVADREANGPFESVDDLDRVRGIGVKTVEKLRPYVTTGEAGDD